jgi:hypothetical protein
MKALTNRVRGDEVLEPRTTSGDCKDARRLTEKDANGLYVMAAVMRAVCDCWDDESELKPHFTVWSADLLAAAQERHLEALGSGAVLRILASLARPGQN